MAPTDFHTLLTDLIHNNSFHSMRDLWNNFFMQKFSFWQFWSYHPSPVSDFHTFHILHTCSRSYLTMQNTLPNTSLLITSQTKSVWDVLLYNGMFGLCEDFSLQNKSAPWWIHPPSVFTVYSTYSPFTVSECSRSIYLGLGPTFCYILFSPLPQMFRSLWMTIAIDMGHKTLPTNSVQWDFVTEC